MKPLLCRAVVAATALVAPMLLMPAASAHWASEDGTGKVAQVSGPDYVCHDGMYFDWANYQVPSRSYPWNYNAATQTRIEDQDAARGALTMDVVDQSGHQITSGVASVPWNPTQITLDDVTPDTLNGQPAIHLVEGGLSWSFGSNLELTNHLVWMAPAGMTGNPYENGIVADCYRFAPVTLGRRGLGTIQVILHGSDAIKVETLTPSTFRVKFADALLVSTSRPTSSSIRDVDGDRHTDLVLTYTATSSQTPVLLTGQTSTGHLLQGAVR